MKIQYYCPLVFAIAIACSSCGHMTKPSGSLRNRVFDYAYQPTIQPPALQLPKGVQRNAVKPALTLPPGQDSFAPVSKEVDLKPPGFAKHYPITDKAPITIKSKRASTTSKGATLRYSAKHVGLLTIQLPYALAWSEVLAALKQSGYVILSENQRQGLIVVREAMAKSHDAVQILVSDHDTRTQVAIFKQNNKLDGSGVATGILEQIKAHLG